MSWVQSKEEKQGLLLGTSAEIRIFDASGETLTDTPIKSLSPGANLLKFHAPHVFLLIQKALT